MSGGVQIGQGRPLKRPPIFTLSEAVAEVQQLWNKGFTKGSKEELALAIGSSVKSSTFRRKANALQHWGLLTTNGGAELSPIASQIVRPVEPGAEIQARYDAFKSIRPYKALQDKFAGAPLPSHDHLANLFIQEYGVPKDYAPEWAEHFVSSARGAGIIVKSGGRDMMASSPPAAESVPQSHAAASAGQAAGASHAAGVGEGSRREGPPAPLGGRVDPEMDPVTIPFGKDRKVVVQMPPDLTDAEIKRVTRILSAYMTEPPEEVSE